LEWGFPEECTLYREDGACLVLRQAQDDGIWDEDFLRKVRFTAKAERVWSFDKLRMTGLLVGADLRGRWLEVAAARRRGGGGK
jgi:hypothetical protein